MLPGTGCPSRSSERARRLQEPHDLADPGATQRRRVLACRLLTGAGTGLAAAALTGLLEQTQRLMWGGTGRDLLQAASQAALWRHIAVLIGAGLLGRWNATDRALQ